MSDRPEWIEVQLAAAKGALVAKGVGEIFLDSIGLLEAIDRGMSLHGTETVQWEFSGVAMQSPLSIRLHGKGASSIIDAVGPGMKSLEYQQRLPSTLHARCSTRRQEAR